MSEELPGAKNVTDTVAGTQRQNSSKIPKPQLQQSRFKNQK
jgi:hypothetical protein